MRDEECRRTRVIYEIRIPAEPDSIYESSAFDRVIGSETTAVVGEHRAPATILSAVVSDDGREALMTIDILPKATDQIEAMVGDPGPFSIAAATNRNDTDA